MRELDEKDYWEKMFQLGKYLLENEKTEEVLKLGIQVYSSFLGDVDENYLYNDTFLPLFTEKFLHFIKFFYRKYPFITELMSVCNNREEIEMIIDDYWKIEGRNAGSKCFIFEKNRYDFVCQEKLEVKVILLIETRRFVFYNSINLTDNREEDKKELCQLKGNLEKFIEIHMGKSENEESEYTE